MGTTKRVSDLLLSALAPASVLGARRTAIAALLSALLVLTACGTGADNNDLPGATGPASTGNGTNVGVEQPGTEDPASTPDSSEPNEVLPETLQDFHGEYIGMAAGDLPADTDFSIFIQDGDEGRVAATSVGCNTIGGTAHWLGDALQVTDQWSTDKRCDAELDELEGQWKTLLQRGLPVQISGRDTAGITSFRATFGATALFFDQNFAGLVDQPLIGTTWRLDAVIPSAYPKQPIETAPVENGLYITFSESSGGDPIATVEFGTEPFTVMPGDGLPESVRAACEAAHPGCRAALEVLGDAYRARMSGLRLMVSAGADTVSLVAAATLPEFTEG